MINVTLLLEQFLRRDLSGDQGVVEPLVLHQLLVGPHLLHLPLVKHYDLISCLDGGESVGDDDAGAALPNLWQRYSSYGGFVSKISCTVSFL